MEPERSTHDIAVNWRGKKFVVDMNVGATLEELGLELQKLTDVKADTMKLIVQSHKSSKLLSPFSDEHSHLTLHETSIIEGKFIRMMGVPKEEVDEVLQNAKIDMRIAGFEEEEKRMRQRMLYGAQTSLMLPQGNYIFCDFKSLHLPGIELTPPASEALRLMHTLAADPGIVAIMNKHRWRVGIMTEMAPEGYVGVSPVCILGLNKNKGEEISLRLRTDDLKGFRKYQSIKKTLLHELAHMVFSEHDANFYALDKQLNQDANTLDWTRSSSHTLSGAHQSQHHELEFHVSDVSSSLSRKLGGNQSSDQLASARAASVAAAYQRLVVESNNTSRTTEAHKEPDPDDSVDITANKLDITSTEKDLNQRNSEPDPDDLDGLHDKFEPDRDDSVNGGAMESESHRESYGIIIMSEPDLDEFEVVLKDKEPDPDDNVTDIMILGEPDPDDSLLHGELLPRMQDPDDSQTGKTSAEPDPDDSMVHDEELQRIQDPVMVACNRLKKSIEMLQSEVCPSEAVLVIQTLFKIVRNVIEHPYETKFRKLRKANPVIQRNIASYKAAMEILSLIGFCEDVVEDEIGRAEAYLVLKRNDPGLLWLAKSSLETCIAC